MQEYLEQLKALVTEIETALTEYTEAGNKTAYKPFQIVKKGAQKGKAVFQSMRLEIQKIQNAKKEVKK